MLTHVWFMIEAMRSEKSFLASQQYATNFDQTPRSRGPRPPGIVFQDFAIPIAFSLVLVVLLWNIVLICKVQYSRREKVTKLTFQPYVISFCFLMSQLLESAILEYTYENPGPNRRPDLSFYASEI